MTRKIALIMAAVVLLVSPMAGNGQAAIAGLANNQWPDVQSVAVGQDHSCALTAYGGVKCWGDNGRNEGTWGDGIMTNETEVGLIASAYSDLPNADARFDNFKVSCLTQGEPWAVTSAPGATANIGPDLIPVNGWADRLTGPAWLRRLPGLDGWHSEAISCKAAGSSG